MVLPCTRSGDGGRLAPEEPRGRSNSIPPAQTPTAKHLLAYLPRPPTDTSRYGTFPQKVWLAPGLSGILQTGCCRAVAVVGGDSSLMGSFPPCSPNSQPPLGLRRRSGGSKPVPLLPREAP